MINCVTVTEPPRGAAMEKVFFDLSFEGVNEFCQVVSTVCRIHSVTSPGGVANRKRQIKALLKTEHALLTL